MKSDTNSYERYQRQTILKEFGIAGQQKLLHSKVLVIGAGGLGCAALQYLAAAGTGHIGIVDGDVVSITNLHRQVLYSTFDIGFSKAEKAKHILTRLNPDITIVAHNEQITPANALTIIEGYDIIIDGTDNFASRYLINDACVLLNKPLVYGAVSKFEGQVAIFNHRATNGGGAANYRDLFPDPPLENEVLNCAEAGVLGVLPGIIGTMQANETIKLIAGVGKPLINSILTYNALNNRLYEMTILPKKVTRALIPANAIEFEQMDYGWFCSPLETRFEINNAAFEELLKKESVDIIDVRNADELPIPSGFDYIQIPLSQLKEKTPAIRKDIVVVFCQSGTRSLQAAQWLSGRLDKSKKIYSLQGGILSWLKTNTANNHE